MLSFSGSLKVFVAVEACDLRKGFNGLHGFANRRHGTIALAGGIPFSTPDWIFFTRRSISSF
jgi:hypothetical protein